MTDKKAKDETPAQSPSPTAESPAPEVTTPPTGTEATSDTTTPEAPTATSEPVGTTPDSTDSTPDSDDVKPAEATQRTVTLVASRGEGEVHNLTVTRLGEHIFLTPGFEPLKGWEGPNAVLDALPSLTLEEALDVANAILDLAGYTRD